MSISDRPHPSAALTAAGAMFASAGVRPPAAVDRETGRVRYIDGLRGISALGVILCHTALLMPIWAGILTPGARVPLRWLGHALVDGAHGVDLFFVLSGFCLAYPTLARRRERGAATFDIARFAAHRIVRLLPPYYAASALLLLAAAVVWAHSGRFAPPGTDPYRPLDLVGQALMLDRGVVLASPPFWTLLVEMRWYLAFPIVLFVFERAPRTFWGLVAATVVAYWFTRLHDLDLGVAPAFLLGVVAADLSVRDHPVRRYAVVLAVAAVGIALLLEPYVSMPNVDGLDERFFYWQTNPGWHLAAFFTVLAAGRLAPLRSVLSLPVPAFVGRASYSIYLMHYPIVAFVGFHLLTHSTVAGFFATVAAAVAGGIAFWALVERHFCDPGPLRDRARAAVEPVVAQGLRWLGLPALLPAAPLRPAQTAKP